MSWRPLVLPPSPPASTDAARLVLSRTGRRDTGPELALRREMHRLGMRFRVDVAAAGTSRRRRVDVLLRGSRIALLVHGCFWHGCPLHYYPPKANGVWWRLKLQSVKERDADTLLCLSRAGWLPLVVWEHEDMRRVATRVQAVDHLRRRLGGY